MQWAMSNQSVKKADWASHTNKRGVSTSSVLMCTEKLGRVHEAL